MNIQPGDIYWYAPPTNGPAACIPHPYVIIRLSGDDSVHASTVTACGITSNMKKAFWPGNVLLEKNEGNLIKKSIVDVSQTAVMGLSELGEYIGTLSKDRMLEVFSGIKFVESLQTQRKKI